MSVLSWFLTPYYQAQLSYPWGKLRRGLCESKTAKYMEGAALNHSLIFLDRFWKKEQLPVQSAAHIYSITDIGFRPKIYRLII